MKTTYILCTLLLAGCVDFGVGVEAADAPIAGEGGAFGAGGGGGGGCVEGPTEPTADGPQLRFTAMSVNDADLAIAPGDVVTWTNGDSMRHAAVAGAPGAETPPERGGFDSGELGQGQQWAWRFCDPGTRVWFCSTHPAQMNGYRITVE